MIQTAVKPAGQWRKFAVMWVLLVVVSGCSTMGETDPAVPADVVQTPDSGPPASDFSDIRLPQSLKPIKDQTFFMQTGGFAAGVLSLRGRVDSHSLVAFFENQMQKDNWRIVGFFKSIRSLMMFYKENRWCVINITERDFFTYVEVWVAPTLHPLDANLIK
jgi:hypothetical protein